jgi:hypothetical protein
VNSARAPVKFVALKHLTDEQRQVIVLKFIRGFDSHIGHHDYDQKGQLSRSSTGRWALRRVLTGGLLMLFAAVHPRQILWAVPAAGAPPELPRSIPSTSNTCARISGRPDQQNPWWASPVAQATAYTIREQAGDLQAGKRRRRAVRR